MDLTQDQIERATKAFIYRKKYYTVYQKAHREEINERQLKYLKKVYDDPEKLKQMKERQKKYYQEVVKPKREELKKLKSNNEIPMSIG